MIFINCTFDEENWKPAEISSMLKNLKTYLEEEIPRTKFVMLATLKGSLETVILNPSREAFSVEIPMEEVTEFSEIRDKVKDEICKQNGHKKTAVFDFDGVIHSYVNGWNPVPSDPPVEGISEVIDKLQREGWKVVICSTRCSSLEGYKAVEEYLLDNKIGYNLITNEKPPALVYVDDRGICFNGNCEGLYEQIVNFKPWNR